MQHIKQKQKFNFTDVSIFIAINSGQSVILPRIKLVNPAEKTLYQISILAE